MPLILGANTLSAGGYEVDNSLRFNSGSSDRLTRTLSSGTSNTIGTISVWVKRANLSATKSILGVNTNGDNFFIIQFGNSSDQLNIRLYDDGSPDANYNTTAVFRDVSAWYHVVVAFDTTQATSSNRIKAYVNNTLHSLSGYPPQNQTLYTGTSSATMAVGDSSFNNSHYDGYMSEYNFIDGQQLAPSDFGEFDEDSGIWKPIAYEGTYGTNGFYLEFKDSSALGDDTSGTGNDFTVNNLTSIDQTTDTPTNNFATMNPLDKTPFGTSITYSDGNTTTTASAGTDWTTRYSFSSLAITQGKWYAECKVGNVGVSNQFYVGVIKDRQTASISTSLGGIANGYGYYANTGNIVNNGVDLSTSGASYTTNNIIGMALDLDNGTLDFYKDGVAQGDQVTGLDTSALWQFANNAYQNAIWNWNFGNPPFAITTGNADANGYGNFEYEVPSGYYSLCTKNLAEYG
jgi:hypothetical protein